jgi:hypothetical protein
MDVERIILKSILNNGWMRTAFSWLRIRHSGKFLRSR